jgi:transcriptional coactivator HFI1/ADA1
MAGTIRPNDMNVATTPTLSSAALPSLDTSTKKPSAPRTPRIDVEPLYAAVKGAISDADWTIYKKTLSFFLLGNLNQEELSRKLKGILNTPALEHAHNALFTAIYANIWRDAPEAGIASWVSSSDKPSSGTIKGTGDESEKRLKYEVMQLSRRERKRLKGIPNEVVAGGDTGTAQEYIDARRAKQIEVNASNIQGGGFGKTSTYLSPPSHKHASYTPTSCVTKHSGHGSLTLARLGH